MRGSEGGMTRSEGASHLVKLSLPDFFSLSMENIYKINVLLSHYYAVCGGGSRISQRGCQPQRGANLLFG